jgi:hypothetical protein
MKKATILYYKQNDKVAKVKPTKGGFQETDKQRNQMNDHLENNQAAIFDIYEDGETVVLRQMITRGIFERY